MKLTLRIVYTILALGFIVGLFYILYDEGEATGEGSIDITVYDQSETVVSSESHLYYEGDTLFKVMDRHYELTCADTQYNPDDTCETTFAGSHILLGIDDVMTDWTNTFLYLEVNDTMATRGVDDVKLEDDNDYAFYVRNVND
ncbi:MAG: hypothetical protein ACQEQA_01315 [Bacillota bacterium]